MALEGSKEFSDTKFRARVIEARDAPVAFAFGIGKDGSNALVMHNLKSGRPLLALLQAEDPNIQQGTFGTARLVDKELLLTCDKPLKGLKAALKSWVKATRHPMIQRARPFIDGQEVADEDEGNETGGTDEGAQNVPPPDAPPAPDAALAELTGRLRKVAQAAAPKIDALGPKFKPALDMAVGLVRSGDAARAEMVIAKLEELVASAGVSGAATQPDGPTPPVQPEQPSPAVEAAVARLRALAPRAEPVRQALGDAYRKAMEAAVASVKAGDGVRAAAILDELEKLVDRALSSSEGFKRLWSSARASWDAASEAVDAQIGALQAVLRTSGDEDLEAIAEYGLNGVTGNFRVPLLAALREVDAADAGARAMRAKAASAAIAAFRAHLASNEAVEVCDDNPFGVSVSIRGTLLPALDRLEVALDAA